MDRDFILQAHSSHALHINSGFQSHDMARANFLFLAPSQPRPFVNLYPQAVARAMHEIRSKAMLIEKAPRGPVDASGGYAGAKSVVRSLLSLLDRFVPPANPSRCASQKNGPRQVTAVVAEYSTQVQHHQFVFLQSLFRGLRMRQRRARPGSHDD